MNDHSLTGSQKSFLRGLGQQLEPQLKIGKEGLTPAFFKEFNALLRAHELVKLRFVAEGDRNVRAALCTQIAADGHCALVGSVGHTALFYREHPDPESRRITLG